MKYEVTICCSYEIENAIDKYDAMEKARTMFAEDPLGSDYFFDINPISEEEEEEDEEND